MKKIVIMGSSSGIGLACAEAFASRGVKVGLAARHTAPLEALKKKYPQFVEYAAIDITRPEATGQLDELIARLGGMNIYFHVAGIGCENLTLEPEREVEILETNSCGFARMICAAYRYFRRNRIPGHIAAITSVAGTNGIGRLSAYSSSKAMAQKYLIALEQLSRSEGAEITFTDIRPGWIDTPLLKPHHRYPMEMDLDYAVPLIIKAIVRRPRVAVIDWRWNILVGLWRALPNCIWTRLSLEISQPDEPMP